MSTLEIAPFQPQFRIDSFMLRKSSVVSTIKRRIDISKLIVNSSDYQVIFQTAYD